MELTAPSTLEDAREEIARLRRRGGRPAGRVIKRAGLGDATVSPAGDDRDDTSLPSYFARSVLGHVRVRLPWLAALLLLQSVSAVILHGFDEMLSKHLAIAMFVPEDCRRARGNAGNQPGVIVTRALDSDRENLLANIGQLLSKEARIGAVRLRSSRRARLAGCSSNFRRREGRVGHRARDVHRRLRVGLPRRRLLGRHRRVPSGPRRGLRAAAHDHFGHPWNPRRSAS